MEVVAFSPQFSSWQQAARQALAQGHPPSTLLWQPHEDGRQQLPLFTESASTAGGAEPRVLPATSDTPTSAARPRVPKEFLQESRYVACHRDPSRWALLYRMLWRLNQGEPQLLTAATDEDVVQFQRLAKTVHREMHKMRAFVRFREVSTDEGTPWFVAWFEPEHAIVELNADFFVERFASLRWSILTPDRCAHWDGQIVRFTPGVTRDQAAAGDPTEELWRSYYRSIFNPARVKIAAMKKEMAPRYWKNLPEAADIPALLGQARQRTRHMIATSAEKTAPEVFGSARVPDTDSLPEVAEAAQVCRACPLWRNATCTVFGQGPSTATVVVVGEQPGDQEDRAGKPFVGPAGQLLDRALAAAGVERDQLYVTNAVKHFKWEPRGKRRLHQSPHAREIAACRPWLEAEMRLIRPRLIVSLGATAAQAVVGPGVKVTQSRGETLASAFGIPALITVHPSSLLRQPDASRAAEDFAALVADLKKIAHGSTAPQ